MFLKRKELYLAAVVVLLTSMALSCSNRGAMTGPSQRAVNSLNRGVAYGEKGEYDQAIADCTEAIRLEPTFAQAYYDRGVSYARKGEFAKAAKDQGKARELSK